MFKSLENALNRLASPDFAVFSSRKQAFAALLTGSVGVGSAVVIPNYAVEWTRSLLQVEKDGTNIAPTKKLRTLLEKAKSDFDYSFSEKKFVRLFSSPYDTCEVFGSVKPAGCKAIIGIPLYLHAENIEEIAVEKKVDSSLTEEEKESEVARFKEASLLSDSAKQYVIGEGLLFAKQPYHYLSSAIILTVSFVATCLQSAAIIQYVGRKKYSFLQRFFVYSMSAFVWMPLSIVLMTCTKEFLFINGARSLNERYIDGGIEYYEKLSERNRIGYEIFQVPLSFWFDYKFLDSLCEQRLSVLRELKKKSS